MRWLLVSFLMFAIGCQRGTPLPGPPPKSASKQATYTKPEEVTLVSVKLPELEKAIASHKGKVVVVDVWSNSCIPCKQEFPHLVQLHKDYSPMGLVCISVSYDDDEDGAKFALPFLKKQNATFENYRLDEDNDVKAYKFEADVLPTVFVYGKDGKRAKKFTTVEPFTYKDVEKFIQPLLK